MVSKMKTIMFAVALFVIATCAFAASDSAGLPVGFTVPEVAMLDIYGSPVAAFTVLAPASAGLKPTVSGVQHCTLNYTTISTEDSYYDIAVEVAAATVDPIPDGMLLNITSATPNGVGDPGNATSGGANFTSLLSKGVGQWIVEDIDSCYTKQGSNEGAVLTYTATIPADNNNIDSLYAGTYAVSMLYTLSNSY